MPAGTAAVDRFEVVGRVGRRRTGERGKSETIIGHLADGGGLGQLAQLDLVVVGAQQSPFGGPVEQQPVAGAVVVGDHVTVRIRRRRWPSARHGRDGRRSAARFGAPFPVPSTALAKSASEPSGSAARGQLGNRYRADLRIGGRIGSIGHGRPSVESSVTVKLWGSHRLLTQLIRTPGPDNSSWPGGIACAHGRRRRASGSIPAGSIETARLAERVGYDGLWSAETSHDPFLPLVLAAEHTERIELGTGIAVAFARNPMTLAVLANDLQTAVQGPVHAGPRLPDQAPHREAVLDAVVAPGAPDARADPGHPGHLGQLVRREPAGLPGRVLPPHPDDPDVRPGPQPLRQPPDLPRRRRARR